MLKRRPARKHETTYPTREILKAGLVGVLLLGGCTTVGTPDATTPETRHPTDKGANPDCKATDTAKTPAPPETVGPKCGPAGVPPPPKGDLLGPEVRKDPGTTVVPEVDKRLGRMVAPEVLKSAGVVALPKEAEPVEPEVQVDGGIMAPVPVEPEARLAGDVLMVEPVEPEVRIRGRMAPATRVPVAAEMED